MVKFAAITADLLARKGEARPWGYAPIEPVPAKPAGFGNGEPEFHHHHHSLEGGRKLTLRLSESDYECLGLIAAKRDVTRQVLLREILDRFLAEAAEEHRGKCGCIGSSCRR